jgi:hypothetical protein
MSIYRYQTGTSTQQYYGLAKIDSNMYATRKQLNQKQQLTIQYTKQIMRRTLTSTMTIVTLDCAEQQPEIIDLVYDDDGNYNIVIIGNIGCSIRGVSHTMINYVIWVLLTVIHQLI